MKTIAQTSIAFVALFLLLTNHAWAQEIPPSLLLDVKKECVAECRANGAEPLICDTLCGCTYDQFSKLALPVFTSLKAELDAEMVSPASQSYLAQVGAICVGELDRVVSGLIAPPTAE